MRWDCDLDIVTHRVASPKVIDHRSEVIAMESRATYARLFVYINCGMFMFASIAKLDISLVTSVLVI